MKFFVIEGLDGSGKSTQTKLLKSFLEKKNIKYNYIHFPRTDRSVFGDLIARFLRGELGDINNVHPYLVSLIYAGDRKDAADIIKKWLEKGELVILDRYVHSNIAFQCAKIKNREEKIKLKDWINHLEYEYFKIPKPDISIFLDVPFSFTMKKLTIQRQGKDRDYLQGGRDIHEEDLTFQEKVREAYLWQVEEDESFKLVNCYDNNGEMLPPEDIFEKIQKVFGFH